jgi:hypothetical protein
MYFDEHPERFGDGRQPGPLVNVLEWYSGRASSDVRVELERMCEHFSKTAGR